MYLTRTGFVQAHSKVARIPRPRRSELVHFLGKDDRRLRNDSPTTFPFSHPVPSFNDAAYVTAAAGRGFSAGSSAGQPPPSSFPRNTLSPHVRTTGFKSRLPN